MTISYFGYGSLVNAETLPEGTDLSPGRLDGWIREWRVCGKDAEGRGRCALSVRRSEGVYIRGVLATECKSGFADLALREKRYDKIDGIGSSFRCDEQGAEGPEDMFLFAASPPHRAWGDETHPILQSYLDCVLKGFFDLWGEEGIGHFLETTEGWEAPVLSDRHAPVYSRAVVLDPDLRALIDERLHAHGIAYLTV